ncbi:MAG: non-canonical purine NTP diphosphatase [Bacteroidetes bacterium]|nr:non-canonical purine NTP diphosphatase [Bacteroidota bacterium]
MKIIFATNNPNKLKEVSDLVGDRVNILSLRDINCFEELPETHDTIEENAAEKARYIYDNYHVNCFAEDTGLEVEAIDGEPGVLSARYAGQNATYEDNIRLLLKKLKGISNRKARFRTIISLIIDGKEIQFEGIVNGIIREEKVGTGGFGYDPLFQPDGHSLTFAQMKLSEKNTISHRAKATQKLIDYLNG